MPKDESVTGLRYTGNPKKYHERRTVSGFRHVRLLCDDAPSQTSRACKSRRRLPSCQTKLYRSIAPFDFVLFPNHKKFLSGLDKPLAQSSVSASDVYINQYRDAFH